MLNVVDRTPLALARKQFRDDFFGASGNPYRTAQTRGQMATGFGLITLASLMASRGYDYRVQVVMLGFTFNL